MKVSASNIGRITVTVLAVAIGIYFGGDVGSDMFCNSLVACDPNFLSYLSVVGWFDPTNCRCITTWKMLFVDYLHLLPALAIFIGWGYFQKN